MATKNKEPYQKEYYAPVPTRWTLYTRTSLIWQFIRFWVLNWKIKVLLSKGHK